MMNLKLSEVIGTVGTAVVTGCLLGAEVYVVAKAFEESTIAGCIAVGGVAATNTVATRVLQNVGMDLMMHQASLAFADTLI